LFVYPIASPQCKIVLLCPLSKIWRGDPGKEDVVGGEAHEENEDFEVFNFIAVEMNYLAAELTKYQNIPRNYKEPKQSFGEFNLT